MEAEQFTQTAAEALKVSPIAIFWIALLLLGLFIAYFTVEKSFPRRMVGTVLTIGVTIFTLFFFINFPMPKGIDLRGGSEFVLEIQQEGEKVIDEQVQQQVMATLQRRLDAGGQTDLNMSPQGTNRILLQMPGITEEERTAIRTTLQTTAKLEIRLVHPQSGPVLVSRMQEGDEFIPGYELVEPYDEATGTFEVLEIRKSLDGEVVSNAFRRYGPNGHEIMVSLTNAGGDIMWDVTGKHRGERLAIVVDDKVVSAPVINDQFGKDFVITGDFSQEEADQLSTFLKNPLQSPIEIQSESSVSPAMGADTIRQGLWAGIAGLSVTLLFVLIYYNFAGLIATIGLAINIVIIFGIMSMFQFVMTMPGIAGLILTIGISIDANVLIYERLREELEAEKSLKAALDAAYGKAFSAIFDANITTLIAAGILLWLATGTIKGFATTLIIGVFGSLFAALLVTRVCFGWLVDSGLVSRIRLWSLISGQNIDFIGMRRKAAVLSTVLLVVAAALIFTKKDSALGVGLRGGDLVSIMSAEGLSVPEIKETLAGAGLSSTPQVQEQRNVGTETIFYTIRAAENEGMQALTHLREETGLALEDTQLESVGSQVGSEMLQSSAIAMLLGLVAIMFYVSLRFESMAFALGAIAAVVHDLVIVTGMLLLFGREISLIMVGALLTIAGYSINDTIVVFDRVREGLKTVRGNVGDVMNVCMNATLGRTVLTSMTTSIVVITLFVFGGPSLNDFALTLIIGVLVGTYSSIFVAAPVVLWWARVRKVNLRREVLDAEAAKAASPAAAAQAQG